MNSIFDADTGPRRKPSTPRVTAYSPAAARAMEDAMLGKAHNTKRVTQGWQPQAGTSSAHDHHADAVTAVLRKIGRSNKRQIEKAGLTEHTVIHGLCRLQDTGCVVRFDRTGPGGSHEYELTAKGIAK